MFTISFPCSSVCSLLSPQGLQQHPEHRADAQLIFPESHDKRLEVLWERTVGPQSLAEVGKPPGNGPPGSVGLFFLVKNRKEDFKQHEQL